MTHHPHQPETGFARLRAAVARAAARALGLDRMKALVLARLHAAIAQLETLLASWQAGTLPPAPAPHAPAAALPSPDAPGPAAISNPAQAPHAWTPSSLFRWPLFRGANLGEAVLGWFLPPLPPVARAPRPSRARPLQAPRRTASREPRPPLAPEPPAARPAPPRLRAPFPHPVTPPHCPRMATCARITRRARLPPQARFEKPPRRAAPPRAYFVTLT